MGIDADGDEEISPESLIEAQAEARRANEQEAEDDAKIEEVGSAAELMAGKELKGKSRDMLPAVFPPDLAIGRDVRSRPGAIPLGGGLQSDEEDPPSDYRRPDSQQGTPEIKAVVVVEPELVQAEKVPDRRLRLPRSLKWILLGLVAGVTLVVAVIAIIRAAVKGSSTSPTPPKNQQGDPRATRDDMQLFSSFTQHIAAFGSSGLSNSANSEELAVEVSCLSNENGEGVKQPSSASSDDLPSDKMMNIFVESVSSSDVVCTRKEENVVCTVNMTESALTPHYVIFNCGYPTEPNLIAAHVDLLENDACDGNAAAEHGSKNITRAAVVGSIVRPDADTPTLDVRFGEHCTIQGTEIQGTDEEGVFVCANRQDTCGVAAAFTVPATDEMLYQNYNDAFFQEGKLTRLPVEAPKRIQDILSGVEASLQF